MTKRTLPATLFIAATASPAAAHVGIGDTTGLLAGVLHPISGFDHVLAMVMIGVWAALLGGRALWLVPLAFVTVMTAGGALGMLGVPLPFAELLIAASIVGLGALIAFEVRLPLAAAIALGGVFAIAHGHAHGSEMPETASGIAYGLGFIAATASLHLAGIGLGMAAFRFAKPAFVRAVGAVALVFGVAIALDG